MALYLALLSLSYSNAQDYSTGNLVNFTGTPTNTTGNWVNGVYVHQLGCFGGNTPGNCGPYPNVQTNGAINFSYGQVNLNQVVNINNALSAAGSGVQVTGFNFGFRAKNGNGWDNGQQDYLDAYVKFYNSKAEVVESYDYLQSTNRRYNWSNFSFNETFAKPYDVSKLAAAQYGFIGRDTNGWAGPYGPEIINVNFSLNYRIDPCVANPASSPSCPGFSNLVKPAILPIVNQTAITSLVPEVATSTPIVNVGGVQLSTTGTITAPDNIPQALKDVQAVTQQSQAATGSSTQQQQQSSKSGPNMSLIMSVIGQIQAADKATQTAAVQNANQVATSSSAKAQEQANQVVEALNTMSQASSQVSMIQSTNNAKLSMPITQQNTSVVQLQQPTSAPQLSFMAPIQPISLTTLQQSMGQVTFGSTNMTASVLPPQVPTLKYESQQKVDTSQTTTYVSIQAEQPKFENKQTESESQSVSLNTSNNISNLSDLFASKINIESLQSEQTSDTVNKNVSVNELAGGVDIASIATTPKGYEAYSFVLQDTAFYKTEAIYKDQKTVDNAKALRQLSSDRLHQEMIDQQYKGK